MEHDAMTHVSAIGGPSLGALGGGGLPMLAWRSHRGHSSAALIG